MFNKNIQMNEEQLMQMAHAVIEKMQKEQLTVQEAMGIDDGLLEEIYSLAYAYYNQGKYKEALNLFQFLANISPNSYKFNLGYGATFHQLKEYENASVAFYLALQADLENPLPAYYLGDCMLQQGLKEEAIEMFELTIEIAGKKKEYKALKERSLLLKKSLMK